MQGLADEGGPRDPTGGAPIDPVAMAGATYSGVDKHWRTFIEDAEAAILAMRTPTVAMIGEWSHHRNPEHVGYDSDCDECATADWQAMIDVALAEKPE